jgi:hypothetical protein
MKERTDNFILVVLKIVSWVIFVGLCINAGALYLNFFATILNSEHILILYQDIDLSEMFQNNSKVFYGVFSLILIISALKAYLFYLVIKLVSKIDLTKPFNSSVSERISSISYYAFSIGLLSYIARITARNLENRGFNIDNLNQFWVDSQAYILMAAVIYVIAVIFSKGVEYQEELEETV